MDYLINLFISNILSLEFSLEICSLGIFSRGRWLMIGRWGGGTEKDQHGGGRCWWRVVLAKSNLKRGECDPAPP